MQWYHAGFPFWGEEVAQWIKYLLLKNEHVSADSQWGMARWHSYIYNPRAGVGQILQSSLAIQSSQSICPSSVKRPYLKTKVDNYLGGHPVLTFGFHAYDHICTHTLAYTPTMNTYIAYVHLHIKLIK